MPTFSWSSEIDSGWKCAFILQLIINNDARLGSSALARGVAQPSEEAADAEMLLPASSSAFHFSNCMTSSMRRSRKAAVSAQPSLWSSSQASRVEA